MFSEDTIKELKCAYSDKEHFLISPISLLCGHSICKSCIPNAYTGEIRCKICDMVSKQDLNEFQVSSKAQKALQLNIGVIFQILTKETTDRLNEFKGMFKYLLIFEILILSVFNSN